MRACSPAPLERDPARRTSIPTRATRCWPPSSRWSRHGLRNRARELVLRPAGMTETGYKAPGWAPSASRTATRTDATGARSWTRDRRRGAPSGRCAATVRAHHARRHGPVGRALSSGLPRADRSSRRKFMTGYVSEGTRRRIAVRLRLGRDEDHARHSARHAQRRQRRVRRRVPPPRRRRDPPSGRRPPGTTRSCSSTRSREASLSTSSPNR